MDVFQKFWAGMYIVFFVIEQKGMTFDHDFGYSSPPFSSLLKIEGRRKGERISKNRDQRSCLSARLILYVLDKKG